LNQHKTILQVPDPILHQISQPITHIDSSIKELARELLHWLESPTGVGIAAPQLGELLRIIVIRRNIEEFVLINPTIIKASKQLHPSFECCLSINHGKALYKVSRHKIVKVSAIDLTGGVVIYKGRDLLGTVLQHEIDHLDGRTIDQQDDKIPFNNMNTRPKIEEKGGNHENARPSSVFHG